MNTFLRKTLLLVLVVSCTSLSVAQKKKIEKANKEFERFSYIDARKIYEEILKDNPENGTAEIYQKLGDTYYLNGQYSEAVDKFTTLKEKFPTEMRAIYYFKLAQSLKSQGKYEEAEEVLNELDPATLAELYPRSIDTSGENMDDYILKKVSINTNSSDFGTSYYQDKLVYASASKISEGDKTDSWTGEPYLDLYVADIDENGELSNSTSLSGEINTRFHESTAAFTKDGTTVYFTRNNFNDGKKATDKNKTIRLKLYKATRSGENGWSDVRELTMIKDADSTINSNDWSTAHPALSLDEKRLYFASDRPGSKVVMPESKKEEAIRLSDIWYVDILPGKDRYSSPKPVEKINTIAKETFPFISEKGELYFSSDGVGSEGGLDVFKTKLDENGIPGEILRFGTPVNSNQDDFGFIWSDAKKMGYFTSNRPNAEGGSAADDIYLVVEKCVITLTGTVTDMITGELLPGSEVILLDENNKVIGAPIIVGEDAAYSYVVECSSQYSLRGTKQGYKPSEKIVTTPGKTDTLIVPLKLEPDCCTQGDLGCCLCLQPIYFDFDKFNIRPDAAIELNKIYIAMREYPQLIVHIESHTDSRGSFAYNEGLSDKRAQSTRDWLVQKGISAERLTAKGYGERQLLDRCTYLDECGQELPIPGCSLDQFTKNTQKCSDGVECSEEEHQTNRRSKFIIMN